MPRREATTWYPVFLDLHGLPVKVIGGGAVAARKVRGLVEAGARVTVIAPKFCPSLARRRGIKKIKRDYRPGDLKGARLLFMATDDPDLNSTIALEAERRGLWANVASPSGVGRMSLPASFRRGPLCVAVSTSGTSSAAASALREDLSEHLDEAWASFLKLLRVRRRDVQRQIKDSDRRRHLLLALGDPIWVTLIRRKGAKAAARRMDELIAQCKQQKRRKKRKTSSRK